MKPLILFTLFLNCFTYVFSQDTIETTSRQLIPCKIISVGPDTISFKKNDPAGSTDDFLLRNQIRQIKLKNGTRMTITYMKNDEFIIDTPVTMFKRNAVKLYMIGLLHNTLRLCYERVLSPGINIETQVGKIGMVNLNGNEHLQGIILKTGIRYFFNRTLYTKKQVQPLNGSYLQIGVYYVDFKRWEDLNLSYQKTRHYSIPGVSFTFGRQTLKRKFCFDYFLGINADLSNQLYRNGDYRWTESPLLTRLSLIEPDILSLIAGISIGYIF